MKTNINVETIFTSIISSTLSGTKNAEELKTCANEICALVNDAYQARYKEIVAEKAKPATSTTKATAKPISAKGKPIEDKKATKATAKATKPTPAPKAEKADEDIISITDTKAIKKLGLKFEKYNDKCFVLRGNTKPLRKDLKEQFKGVFNSHLTGGEGWVFASKYVEPLAKALGVKVA